MKILRTALPWLLVLLLTACAARQQRSQSLDGGWLCDADYSWRQMYPGKVFKEDIIYRALKENYISLNFERGEMRMESLSGSQPPQYARFKIVRREGNSVTISYLDEPARYEVFSLTDENTLIMYNTAQPKVTIRYKRAAKKIPAIGSSSQ